MSESYQSHYPYHHHHSSDAAVYPLGIMLFFGVCFIFLVVAFSYAAYSDHSYFAPIGAGPNHQKIPGPTMWNWNPPRDDPKNNNNSAVPQATPASSAESRASCPAPIQAVGSTLKPPWCRGTNVPVYGGDVHHAMMSSVTASSFLNKRFS